MRCRADGVTAVSLALLFFILQSRINIQRLIVSFQHRMFCWFIE
jgi:hypothetical protein